MKTPRSFRVILICLSLLFGGSAVTDLAVDEKQDIAQLGGAPHATNSNSVEAIGKGFAAMLALYAAQRLDSSAEGERAFAVSIDLPSTVISEGNARALVAEVLDRHKADLTKLLREQIPKELREVLTIDEIRITYAGDSVTVSVTIKIKYRDGLDSLLGSVARDIQALLRNLFMEKMQRIGKEMIESSVSFEQATSQVVKRQLEERKIT